MVGAKPRGDVSKPLLAVTKLHEPGVEVSIERFSGLTHNREKPSLVLIKRQPIEVVRAEHEPGIVVDLTPVAALVFDADLIVGDERLEGLHGAELRTVALINRLVDHDQRFAFQHRAVELAQQTDKPRQDRCVVHAVQPSDGGAQQRFASAFEVTDQQDRPAQPLRWMEQPVADPVQQRVDHLVPAIAEEVHEFAKQPHGVGSVRLTFVGI